MKTIQINRPVAMKMLKALSTSGNLCAAGIATRILDGRETIESELNKNHGGFITSVLKGDYLHAIAVADSENAASLLKIKL